MVSFGNKPLQEIQLLRRTNAALAKPPGKSVFIPKNRSRWARESSTNPASIVDHCGVGFWASHVVYSLVLFVPLLSLYQELQGAFSRVDHEF